MPSFYVSDHIHPNALSQLTDMGVVHLGYGSAPVRYSDVSDRIDAVVLRGEIFDAEKIAASTRLKIIARHGVGTDNVDIPSATRCGVWVTTTPGSNSRAVAEHVFALTLTLARQIVPATQATTDRQWADAKATLGGFELRGRTMGLYGFGSIARSVADIARAFGMRVHVTDPYVDAATVTSTGAHKVTFEDLIAESDVISLHVPLTDDTRHIIDDTAIARMRPGAVLINTARGGLIDESAVMAALEDGRLGGVALDVLEGESTDMSDPFPHSRLTAHLGTPNLIITPHIGGQTDESLLTAGLDAVACVRQALAGTTPDNTANTILPREFIS